MSDGHVLVRVALPDHGDGVGVQGAGALKEALGDISEDGGLLVARLDRDRLTPFSASLVAISGTYDCAVDALIGQRSGGWERVAAFRGSGPWRWVLGDEGLPDPTAAYLALRRSLSYDRSSLAALLERYEKDAAAALPTFLDMSLAEQTLSGICQIPRVGCGVEVESVNGDRHVLCPDCYGEGWWRDVGGVEARLLRVVGLSPGSQCSMCGEQGVLTVWTGKRWVGMLGPNSFRFLDWRLLLRGDVVEAIPNLDIREERRAAISWARRAEGPVPVTGAGLVVLAPTSGRSIQPIGWRSDGGYDGDSVAGPYEIPTMSGRCGLCGTEKAALGPFGLCESCA